ncbi:hypothetical protein E4634_20995, partial [Mangrovimicrobium sediminis]
PHARVRHLDRHRQQYQRRTGGRRRLRLRGRRYPARRADPGQPGRADPGAGPLRHPGAGARARCRRRADRPRPGLGAAGVVVPMVSDAQTAAQVAQAMRYPPAGLRSFGRVRNYYGNDTGKDSASASEPLCFAMIETAQGMDNLEAIAAVEGTRRCSRRSAGLSRPAASTARSPPAPASAPTTAARCWTSACSCWCRAATWVSCAAAWPRTSASSAPWRRDGTRPWKLWPCSMPCVTLSVKSTWSPVATAATGCCAGA